MALDVFISYRRSSGSEAARLIATELRARGLKVFLDVVDMEAGHFDETLLHRIEEAPNFVVILSPGCLERCQRSDDFFLGEISHALTLDRVVIPVLMPSFEFPPASEMPEKITPLWRHQAVTYS